MYILVINLDHIYIHACMYYIYILAQIKVWVWKNVPLTVEYSIRASEFDECDLKNDGVISEKPL